MCDHLPGWDALMDVYGANRPAAALAQVRRCLEVAPDDWAARLVLGDLLADARRLAEARAVLLRLAEERAPNGTRGELLLRKALGKLHDLAGEPDLAIEAYARMRELEPDDATGYVLGGALLACLGRLSEAEAMHRAGTSCITGACDESWYNLGLVLRAQERYAEASAALERAIALDPDYADAHEALADVRATLALG